MRVELKHEPEQRFGDTERKRMSDSPEKKSWKENEKAQKAWGVLLFGLIGATATTFAVPFFLSAQSKPIEGIVYYFLLLRSIVHSSLYGLVSIFNSHRVLSGNLITLI